MKSFKKYITEVKEFRDGYHIKWNADKVGYSTHHKDDADKELSFHKAKDEFDRGDAWEGAKKHIIRTISAQKSKEHNEREHYYQHVKPLSTLEHEWVGLHKKLKSSFNLPKDHPDRMNDKELDRYSKLGKSGIIRTSLLHDTHEVMK
jgi:hypothetical protein